MKAFSDKISNRLTRSNWWIILTSVIFVSFTYYMTFKNQLGGSFIYLNEYKWTTFVKFLPMMICVFSPQIVFAIFRNKINSIDTKILKISIWISIFVVYPSLYLLLDSPIYLGEVKFMSENITIIGVIILIIEVLSNPQPIIPIHADISTWKQKVSPEWIVIILFLMLAIYIGLNLKMEHSTDSTGFKSGFWIAIQSFTIVLVYYIFYLVNHFFLVNHIYSKKGIVYYLFSFVALMLIFTVPLCLLYYYLPAFRSTLNYKLGEDWIGPEAPTAFFSTYSASIFYIMYLTIPITILVQWIGMAKKVNALEQEKINTELNLLKQQINPHFFFNTLNNIYSMSRKKNKATPEAILQLSDLMRYVIYKGQEDTVSLDQEIKYIEDYVELQKLRLHQQFDFQFNIDIIDNNCQVTPLLFIIFVENSFKHGIEVASEDSYLHLNLIQNDSQIIFSCTNSIEEKPKNKAVGLGLNNLERRLELSYPNAYNINLRKKNDHYQAILTLDL